MKDSKILLIIDGNKQYSYYTEYFTMEQVARLFKHKSWYQYIPLQDPNTEIPIEASCKTTSEEDQGV